MPVEMVDKYPAIYAASPLGLQMSCTVDQWVRRQENGLDSTRSTGCNST